MNFLLPIRNAETGEERNFSDKQQIADFLATCANPQQWEGWSHLGPLPVAQIQAAPGDAATAGADGY